MKKMIIVCGPTATGKTALALSLAHELGGELISADSRQIYRGMDIGTGKDLENRKTIESLKQTVRYGKITYRLIPYDVGGVPLWMYDVVRPDESFSVAHYQHLADQVIDSVLRRGNVPVVVGGTGLYIRSIIKPFETAGIKPDMKLRETLTKVILTDLQEMVKSENSAVWDTMNVSDRSNPRRLIRKLEIIRSEKSPQQSGSRKMDFIVIGLTAPNPVLYGRIDARVEKRMDEGLLDEIENLQRQGFDWRLPSFDALGYRQWRKWFEEKIPKSGDNKNKIIMEWKHDEHSYSRRQMTWFKRDTFIRWFDVSQRDAVKNAKETVMTWYNTRT